jgi:hypothetical protein
LGGFAKRVDLSTNWIVEKAVEKRSELRHDVPYDRNSSPWVFWLRVGAAARHVERQSAPSPHGQY